MTSKDDIENAGGTCEVVSIDFWICKDRDGKEWWCSNRGQDCIPAPFVRPPWRFIAYFIGRLDDE